ncbi:DUF6855 family protein [uncultured Psychroserpens sp.]|uniref:DUF6855 family protein n=1 Tax=uncultured Psychroserpens sp. TaxID=255436 RepID=UPI0026298D2A|nr:hypothetical protein [uncultured Psychroserpens sp.]
MNYKEKIGTKDNPIKLKTPPLSSEYTMHVGEKDGKEILVCTVKSTILHYDIRCIEDAYLMLKERNDWIELGSKDEKAETKPNTFEHWGRSTNNPIGGWYGLKKGLRGRFGMYIPPLLEAMGLAEVTHKKRGNSMRAK